MIRQVLDTFVNHFAQQVGALSGVMRVLTRDRGSSGAIRTRFSGVKDRSNEIEILELVMLFKRSRHVGMERERFDP